ncbi:MAG: aminopeptidase [Oscillospiraceae bacterium]|nr:aminopeptidase [Oscillospiraceae bacterium]
MQEKFKEYASLIVRVGANVQKGQTVVVSGSVDNAWFVRLLAEECYEAGAREVVVRWKDDETARMKYLRADPAVFDHIPKWLVEFYNGYAEEKATLIGVMDDDPELLKGVDPDRIQRWGRASGAALKEYVGKQMQNEFAWCGVSIPSPAWAKKVFPDAGEEEAVEKLWDAIFKAVHVGNGDAVDLWLKKVETMARRAQTLTDYAFASLRYKNALGTDLTVGLPDGHKWVSCGEKAKTGFHFVANMPTEEIFTLPKKDAVNGVLRASMPLSLKGNLIEDIVFTLKDGKIIDAKASKGLDILEKELDLDEGARYLGEAALVPHDSPINQMNILFYNTLFDENASCHFAFGKAYPAFLDGTLTEERKKELGANDSFTHIDFMVGTEDLSITGVTKDGREIPVFVNGNFAF